MIRWTSLIAATAAACAVAQLAACDGDTTPVSNYGQGGFAGQANPDAGPDSSSPDTGVDQVSEPAQEASPETGPEPSPEAGPDVQPEAQAEAGTGWTIDVAEGAPKFKNRVSLATDKSGNPHLAYNVATSTDGWDTPSLWYATYQGGTWKKQLVVDAQGVSAEFPVIVIDSNDTPHIFFNRAVTGENQVDVFMVSGDGKGGFNPPVNITGTTTVDEYAATVAIGTDAAFNVIYQRRTGNPGSFVYSMGYQRVYGGALDVPMELATGTSMFSLNPDYAIAASPKGFLHVLYCRPSDNPDYNTLYHRLKNGTGWGSEIPVSETTLDTWGPAVAVDPDGEAHIVYTKGADWDHKTLYYSQFVNGVITGGMALTSSIDDRSYYLGIASPGVGLIDVAFARFYSSDAGNNGDILFLHGHDGIMDPEERITQTLEGDEYAPSIALGPGGVPLVAFVENLSSAPNGKVYLARRASAP
jgi:hypothetical protein